MSPRGSPALLPAVVLDGHNTPWRVNQVAVRAARTSSRRCAPTHAASSASGPRTVLHSCS
eukprot:4276369-Lingulodinium_polyedra.AAC.1